MPRPFESELVIEEKISDSFLRAYHVGFDQNKFRLQPLVDIILSVVPEFSLGYYEAPIPMTQIANKLREAARLVYLTDNYQKRGEFGEIILHLLLRDFHGTIPLVSKVYFKDSHNVTVHGFDGIHVTTNAGINKLWLGESKLYTDGEDGVSELVEDLKSHLTGDFLHSEFELISNKLPREFPNIEYWRNLMHKHQRLDVIYQTICIPMLCTYTSSLFTKHNDATKVFFDDFLTEVMKLKEHFETKRGAIHTDVEVYLLLLPIPNKDELNTELDQRLKYMQRI